ncbi:uncharacterized protein LOC131012380 isoform X2 [Salvia miltiorrhiza]|nr:uncharacterized protein LOC131012380 isoform X2 [Salvia miltiorrhiza]
MMAAPPVKSQPLHNFSLPHLKWAHKNSSPSAPHNHRFRRRDHHRRTDPDPDPDNPKPPADDPAVDEENGEGKPWKLRPRKEPIKAPSASKKETNNDGVKSQRLRGMAEGAQQSGSVERTAKRKVWISLSREEIEEDVYALTGGKPARRPKKWPKNVQKQLDGVFPGLYLVGVAADSYRVMMS